MKGRNIRTLLLFASIVIALACAPGAAPTLSPTLDPFALDTVIAQTAGAAATQTAFLAPPTFTPTPLPTSTPTELPTATPTFIFVLASPTASPRAADTPSSGGQDYSCDILSQLPENNSEFAPRAVFMTRWQVRNNGSQTWNSASTDYRYTGGDKLHANAIYDLIRSVPPGNTTDIVVDMIAPQDPGTYTTTWKLRVGRTEFCTMRLTITVK